MQQLTSNVISTGNVTIFDSNGKCYNFLKLYISGLYKFGNDVATCKTKAFACTKLLAKELSSLPLDKVEVGTELARSLSSPVGFSG